MYKYTNTHQPRHLSNYLQPVGQWVSEWLIVSDFEDSYNRIYQACELVDISYMILIVLRHFKKQTTKHHIPIYRRQSLGDPVMGRGSKLSPCHTPDSHTLVQQTKRKTIPHFHEHIPGYTCIPCHTCDSHTMVSTPCMQDNSWLFIHTLPYLWQTHTLPSWYLGAPYNTDQSDQKIFVP